MTQLTEAEFHDLVAAWLAESFTDVEHEPRLYYDDGDRWVIPDFIAHTPFESYVLEIEDTTSSLYSGIGQAAIYGEVSGHTPVLVFPADNVPEPPTPDWLILETV